MVAGDLVNTASGSSRWRRPGPSSSARRRSARPVGRIAFEEAGEQMLKGKAAPVPAWRALRVVAERRRPEPGRGPRGAVRRARRRAAAPQGPVPRHRRESAAAAGVGHRPGRHRQEPAGVGVPQVRRRDRRGHLLAQRPLAGLRRGHHVLGARRDGPRARAGWPRPTTRRRPARRSRETVTRVHRRRSRTALGRACAAGAAWAANPSVASDQLFGAWRTFFERIAARGTGRPGVRGPPLGGLRACSTSSTTSWSGAAALPIYVVTLARPELLERRPDWGAGKRNFTSLYLEPLPEPAMRELLAGLVPGPARRAPSTRSWLAPTASRCTRSRPSACSSPTGRLVEARRRLRPERRPDDLAVPETLTALIAARLDAPGRRPTGRSSTTRRSSARASPWPGSRRCPGSMPAELEPRLRASSGASCSSSRVDPRSPERGQYAFVQALIREVAYNTLARADRKARHLAAARYFESLGYGRARRRARPATTSPPMPMRRPRARGRRARRPRRESRCGRGRSRGRPRRPRPGRRVPRAGADGHRRSGGQGEMLERASESAEAGAAVRAGPEHSPSGRSSVSADW